MKTLIALALTTLSIASFAHTEKFEKCEAGDKRLIELSRMADGNHELKTFIQNELLEDTMCEVSKPRYVHPAVCGTTISQVDTFKFYKGRGSLVYTVVVDSSYRSCLRYIRIPSIIEFSFKQMPILPNQ